MLKQTNKINEASGLNKFRGYNGIDQYHYNP